MADPPGGKRYISESHSTCPEHIFFRLFLLLLTKIVASKVTGNYLVQLMQPSPSKLKPTSSRFESNCLNLAQSIAISPYLYCLSSNHSALSVKSQKKVFHLGQWFAMALACISGQWLHGVEYILVHEGYICITDVKLVKIITAALV